MSAPITLLIILVTGGVSLYAFNNSQFRSNALFVPALIKHRGEQHRWVSSGFVHGDLMHLIFNMYALYIFGGHAEFAFAALFGETLGGGAYLLFYLVSIVVANLMNYKRHQDNYGYRALGASGAVAAVMWPFIMLAPWDWFVFPPLPAFALGIGYILYSQYADRNSRDNIDHSAHLWGAIFGLTAYVLLCVLFQPLLLEVFWTELLQPRGPG